MSLVLSTMFTSGYGITFDTTKTSTDKDWTDNQQITWNVKITFDDNRDLGYLNFHWSMGDSVYRDGTVNVGKCHKLPGGGTVTTGEYDVLTNDTNQDDTRHIEHTTEESNSSETSLDVTFDETNNTSVEAGADFPGGSATATTSFETHLGITHGSVASTEKTTSRTISDDITVPAGRTQAANFTLDNVTTECDIQIDSTIDWPSMTVRIYRHHCTGCAGTYGIYSAQGHILTEHGVISSHGRNVNIDFGSTDDVYRLAEGTSPRCSGCHFRISGDSVRSLYNLNSPEDHYHIQLDGKRRSTAKDSASVHILDITGLDKKCIEETLGKSGTLISDIDSDDNGVPDNCE